MTDEHDPKTGPTRDVVREIIDRQQRADDHITLPNAFYDKPPALPPTFWTDVLIVLREVRELASDARSWHEEAIDGAFARLIAFAEQFVLPADQEDNR